MAKQLPQYIFIILITMVAAITIVVAAPSVSPPNGNPEYPFGPPGPPGDPGNTGLNGQNGQDGFSNLDCLTQTSNPALGSAISVSCPVANPPYIATGGGFVNNDGGATINWNDVWSRPIGAAGSTPTAWECGRTRWNNAAIICHVRCCRLTQ